MCAENTTCHSKRHMNISFLDRETAKQNQEVLDSLNQRVIDVNKLKTLKKYPSQKKFITAASLLESSIYRKINRFC